MIKGQRISSFIILCMLAILSTNLVYADVPKNRYELNKHFWAIWSDNRTTFYCDCKFDKHKVINYKSCDYEQSDSKRGDRVEIEHIMPAQQFGQHFSCWRENPCKKRGEKLSNRQCCMKTDERFRAAHNDMHNLVPAIGELNQHRGAMRFTEFSDEKKAKIGKFNGCEFYIDKSSRKVEPAPKKKGLVARANLYMADTYKISLSKNQRKLFEAWDRQHPPSKEEWVWHVQVSEKQETVNRYIMNHFD